MKRLFKIMVVICLSAVLCACGNGNDVINTGVTTEETSYDVKVFSSNNVEIVLNSIARDGLSFNVTNKTNENIGIDCYYIILDGVITDYFNGEEYNSYVETVASGDTYEVILNNSISNTDCKTFSAVFGVWEGDSGNLVEYTNISKMILNEDSGATFYSVIDDLTQIYESDTVTIYVDTIEYDTMIFDVTNNSDEVISISCDNIQLDDTIYKCEDLVLGAPILEIAAGDTIQYKYITSSDIIDINADGKIISGIFNIWQPISGNEIEKVNISDVSI